jgi:hypothetical protein
MHRLGGYQRAFTGRFRAETETLLDKAADAGLRVVCNDPRGDWGSERVDARTFTRLISNLFYYDAPTADLMLRGTGYSTHGHYLFALRAPNGAQLCYFMIAEWPWGWEGTYTMLDGRYAGPSIRLGAARILVLLANALFLGRHGADALVYGEANAMNMRPCIQSGYVGQVPHIIPGPHPVHVNVAWADHPVGTFGTEGQAPGTPPSFTEAPYAHYSVGRLAPELVAPFTERALTFLDVRG